MATTFPGPSPPIPEPGMDASNWYINGMQKRRDGSGLFGPAATHEPVDLPQGVTWVKEPKNGS